MLDLIKCFLLWTWRIYYVTFAGSLAIFILLALWSRVGAERSKLKFYSKFVMVYFAVIMGTALLTPIFLLRPRDVINCKIVGWVCRKCSYIMNITWEVRNAKHLQSDYGALVCANHQSSIDILAMLNVWQIMKRVTGIAKNEMFWVLPFGPAAWLAGISFVNRKSPKKAYQTLNDCANRMKNEDIRMFIYPEGTRNNNRGLLPFKKGAFKTAIMGQVPIIPVVMSPYYFIDWKKHMFTKGHVIIKALEPISTKGLEDKDHEELMEKCRNAMLVEYEKLAHEIDTNCEKKEWRDRKRPRLQLFDKLE